MHSEVLSVDQSDRFSRTTPHPCRLCRACHIAYDGEPPSPVEKPHSSERHIKKRWRCKLTRWRRGQDWMGGTRPWRSGPHDGSIGGVSGPVVARTEEWDGNSGSKGGARQSAGAEPAHIIPEMCRFCSFPPSRRWEKFYKCRF